MDVARIEGPFRVGNWIVDPTSRELRPSADAEAASGEVQRLGHKPLTVLQCLAAAPGQVVTKDELIGEVWNGAATTDDAVMAVVYELRKALGDDARAPRYVETIRQRGYRLVAQVRSTPDGDAEQSAQDLGGGARAAGPPRRKRRVAIWGAGFLVVALLLILAARDRIVRSAEEEAQPATDESVEDAQVKEVPEIGSLAIRPFATFGDQCSEEPFVDSLTELLIAELVEGPPLEILGHGAGAWWPAEASADAVVEGSILRSGEGLWVNVRLVESTTGRLIWGASYERQGVDLLLERALASQIAGDLEALMARPSAKP
ncbi:MAG: winged helix-turn-helix domain-containing protein [Thermoanaerobaculia bacterium]|nr:winged helix-turn-helix domain-containing protein [Thermoanaerobaculia bacterium]